MAKKTAYVYDRNTKRWRKNGKWCKAPTRAQLRKGARGQPLDAAGKQVPSEALAGRPERPAKAAKSRPDGQGRPRNGPKRRTPPHQADKQPKRKRAGKRAQKQAKQRPVPPPRRHISTLRPPLPRGPVHFVPEGHAVSSHAVFSSVFENVRDPEHAGHVLYNAISRAASKARIATGDVLVYQYGVQFINTRQSGNLEDMANLTNWLSTQFPDYTFKYSSDSLHVLIGDTEKPVSPKTAKNDLLDRNSELRDIWAYLDDQWDGDIGWFVIAENDEFEGGSG